MNLSRSVYLYKHKENDDEEIEKLIKEIALKHKRYGFRKIFHLIRQKGLLCNHKRVYRVYKMLGLHLKRKPKKRFPKREKVTLYQPASANEVWALDYMSDALIPGKR